MLLDSAAARMAILLKQRRLELRISQRVLADSAGVNQSVVSRAERGGDALLSTWDALFRGLGEYLVEEAERRRANRRAGMLARFG